MAYIRLSSPVIDEILAGKVIEIFKNKESCSSFVCLFHSGDLQDRNNVIIAYYDDCCKANTTAKYYAEEKGEVDFFINLLNNPTSDSKWTIMKEKDFSPNELFTIISEIATAIKKLQHES